MLGQLDDTQINNVLSSQVIGRLACTDGAHPYIVPVTFSYDGKYIYGQTNEGMKLNILRKNPAVCFEVDIITDMRNWQSVIVYGKFEELKRKQDEEKARQFLVNRVFPLLTSSTIYTYGHKANGRVDVEDTTGIKQIIYRIKIMKKTGRFERQ